MGKDLDVLDEFKIINKEQLSGADIEVLSLLYLPLIGIDAFSLYNVLFYLPQDETFTHKILFDSLSLHNINILLSAREKLEAIGLLDCYFHHQGRYIYHIKRPLSFSEFNRDIILSNLLQAHIGKFHYERIVSAKDVTIRAYKNITKSFNNVFDTDIKKRDPLHEFINKKLSTKVQIDYSFFDYLIFKSLFGDHFIDDELLEDKEFKDNIHRIAYLYKLNEEQMYEAIIKTFSINQDFNYEQLSINARKMFQEKHQAQDPVLKSKHSDPLIRSDLDPKEQELIKILSSTNPVKMLEELSGIKPSVAEIKLVEDLLANTKFPPGVINVMILLVTTEKDGVIPSYNYFEKIANTWARANIKTTEDAFLHIQKPRQTKQVQKRPYYSGRKQTVKRPDWYDDYEQQLADYEEKQAKAEEDANYSEVIEKAKKLFSAGENDG